MVSIIIVSYNTKDLLRQCLESIHRFLDLSTYEVIIIDNNSTDGTVSMLEKDFPSHILVRNELNKGFAAANNQGAAIARGDFLLLLNSDTELIDDSMKHIVEHFSTNKHLDIGGCKLLNADRTIQPSCRSFPTVWNVFTETFFLYAVFPRTKIFGAYHMTYFNYDVERNVDVIMGAFMLIRKSVIKDIGLFDESFFMYAEETDFCFRARRMGYSIIFFPQTSVVHYGGGSIKSKTQYFIQIHTAQIKFIQKHFHGVRYLVLLLLKVIGIGLRIPVYFISGLLTLNPSLMGKSRSYVSVLRSLRNS